MPPGTRPSPVTRTTKVVFGGTYGPTAWNNVMWIFLNGEGEIEHSDLVDLAGELTNAYVDHFIPLMSGSASLQTCQVVLYSSGSDVFDATVSFPTPGSVIGGACPANVAACISWDIAPHYRGGHPRTYITGIPNASLADVAHFSGSFVTALDSAAEGFHTDVESIAIPAPGISSVTHGVVSFVRDGAWRTPPIFYRITGAHVDSRVDTQRRRLGADIS